MKTNFENLSQLKNLIEAGQELYIDNHINKHRSRVTRVIRKQSYFFTVDNNGKESWIINGVQDAKNFGFSFSPEFEKVDIFTKKDNMPFLTLHFNTTIIEGKKNISQPLKP